MVLREICSWTFAATKFDSSRAVSHVMCLYWTDVSRTILVIIIGILGEIVSPFDNKSSNHRVSWFWRTRRLVAMLIEDHHWTVFSASSLHFKLQPILLGYILVLYFNLYLRLRSSVFTFDYPTKILYAFLISTTRATNLLHIMNSFLTCLYAGCIWNTVLAL